MKEEEGGRKIEEAGWLRDFNLLYFICFILGMYKYIKEKRWEVWSESDTVKILITRTTSKLSDFDIPDKVFYQNTRGWCNIYI